MARRTGAVAVVVAAAAVLTTVVVVRGGTAVGDEVLLAPAPSAPPSTGPPRGQDPGVLLLDANGVPGLRLGQPAGDGTPVFGDRLPDGSRLPCVQVGPGPADGGQVHPVVAEGPYQVGGWVQDDVVTGVVVSSWTWTDRRVPDVTSWLGVTLGSPVAAAEELPGARTEVHRPFGAAGSAVRVVRVPLPGGARELVVGAVPPDLLSPGAVRTPQPLPDAGAAARVTSLQVRDTRARACTLQPLVDAYLERFAAPATLTVRARAGEVDVPGGVVRLGGPVDQLEAAGLAADENPALLDRRCRTWTDARGVTALSYDDTVVAVSTGEEGGAEAGVGFAWDELGVRTGDPLDAVAAAARDALGEGAAPAVRGAVGSGGAPLTVRVSDEVVVEVHLAEDVRLVPELDQAVYGPEPLASGTRVLALAPGGSRYPC